LDDNLLDIDKAKFAKVDWSSYYSDAKEVSRPMRLKRLDAASQLRAIMMPATLGVWQHGRHIQE
jgi:hypothetical protein